MSTAAPLSFRPESTIGALVAARPLLARTFEKLGIDYCCGGRQSLAAVCARLGLDVATTIRFVESACAAPVGSADVDAAALGQAELADHIEATHHAYLKVELPRLVEMAARVAGKHAQRDSRLPVLCTAVRDFAEEMLAYMQKEEMVLFPLVRDVARGRPADLAGLILQMKDEHQLAENLTARLRLLTDGFTPGPDACNTHRALLAGLAELETDLYRHVHKENNLLFPRALERCLADGKPA